MSKMMEAIRSRFKPQTQTGMTPERYHELLINPQMKLIPSEIDAGWHFCYDWDGMLIHKTWPEYEMCNCE